MDQKAIAKKLMSGVILLIVLSVVFCITTFALVYSMISVDSNIFGTGSVSINLNDGNPIIAEQEFHFEPGMTVKKEFFIENNSSCSVYYKLYFGNVGGGLSDVLEITVSDGDKVLYQGTAKELNRENVLAADDELAIGEKRTLTVTFHFPDDAGNSAKNQLLTFDLCADAVQTKNNPYRLFD